MGRKTFALHWNDRVILKLDKARQELLFEIRPEPFQRFPMGSSAWSCVELAHLDDDELGALVQEAWSQVVPKKVSRPVLEAGLCAKPPGAG